MTTPRRLRRPEPKGDGWNLKRSEIHVYDLDRPTAAEMEAAAALGFKWEPLAERLRGIR